MSATTSTSIKLLMRDGACRVTFSPALDAAQYEEMLRVTNEAGLLDELQVLMKLLADR